MSSTPTAAHRPNLLFLMTDQMQGAVLDPEHVCQTPNFRKLQARGVRFTRAYTPNAICSPARASLMTGLLPHNHNVWTVTHTVRDDRAVLRDAPHWAEWLDRAGYRTGYFGKWHIERSYDLARFGWREAQAETHPDVQDALGAARRRMAREPWRLEGYLSALPGYAPSRFYGVTAVEPEARGLGVHVRHAERFLDAALRGDEPWACFVSVLEPHDPFLCGEEAFEAYNLDDIPLSPSLRDDLEGRPGVYDRARRPWRGWTEHQHRGAAACYYASITEIDALFGRLLDRIESAGQTDSTLVVLTSDHGEALGAHGLYCKNFSASEEIYRVPLVVAGPGVRQGMESAARVGLHDLRPTLLELLGMEFSPVPDSCSFASELSGNFTAPDDYAPERGFAEYEGTRFQLTQRIVWDGPWKYVFNGFDRDEMYNLETDPHEMINLMTRTPRDADRIRHMNRLMWDTIRRTGDLTLLGANYPVLRIAEVGPEPSAT